MNVLIVDDRATNRKLLRVTLEAEGVTVGEAVDGVVALERLTREKFDAVISDLQMPRMDGYQLFQEIRRDPRWRNLPIIAYTSTYLSTDDERLALHSGADRYLRKPVPIQTLLRTLNELLQPNASRRSESPFADDSQVMHEYNSVLTRKLAEKSAELKERNTALGNASHELAENRARYGSIIASAMDAIITINETDGIVLFNSAAETMFGSSASAMIGKPITNLLHKRFGTDDASDLGALMGAGLIGRRTGVFNAIAGQHANGTEFPVEGSFSIAEVDRKLLFTVILRDISERIQVEEQLRLANEQLRALTARNENIREHERTTVAREIHDVLAQDLTCLKIDLSWVAKRITGAVDEPTREAVAERIRDAIGQVHSAISTVQRIATDLRPVVLDSLGLPAAVEWQAEDFARRSGLVGCVQVQHEVSRLSRECANAVFRVLQESTTNIARHACATEFTVRYFETAAHATLVVSDNGCGITPAQVAAPRSIGLVGMRERAQAFGGTVEISGEPGVGTTITMEILLDQENASRPP